MQGSIIPTMIFRNVDKAIEWLGTAFGFQTHLVVRGEAGTVAHAQLVLAGGMIMLGEGSGHEADE